MSFAKEDSTKRVPKITVVMPSFNQAVFIERSILSVLDQNYPNLEFILIDGGSTDGTLSILERYQDSFAYVYTGPDAGQSDALNHGFSKATGDIYGWLNSDDLYLPGAFQSVSGAFCSAPDASVIFGDWLSIDSDDNTIETNYAFDFNLHHFIYEGFHLNSQAMFWRREAHQRFGEFGVDLHRTMDYDLIARLGINEGQRRFMRVTTPLAAFRRHSAQKTTGAGQDVVAAEHRKIAQKNGFSDKYSRKGRILRLVYRARRAYWYLKRGGLKYAFSRLVRAL